MAPYSLTEFIYNEALSFRTSQCALVLLCMKCDMPTGSQGLLFYNRVKVYTVLKIRHHADDLNNDVIDAVRDTC